jgi:carbonic anhydrase/acetyltransferase-like protein (isoleucine patch superfamily)
VIYQLDEHQVVLEGVGHFIADSAAVMGRVTLGAGANVWFNSVIRGDNDDIRIGARCNIQDGSVLHVDPGHPMILEEGVSIGHKVMLHGCTIGQNTLIGINSVILNGAKIGKNCLIGANSLIAEGKEIPDGSMVIGSPGRVRRQLSDEEIERLAGIADNYVKRAQQFLTGLKPDPRFIQD